MSDVLRDLLRVDPALPEQADFDAWWPRWLAVCGARSAPIDRAIAAGFATDRVAWAFAAGYQAALRRLDPTLSDGEVAALCVTEKTGRPRDILTALTPQQASKAPKDSEHGWRLRGDKRFVSLADRATVLLVAARAGEVHGRPDLRLVRVLASDPGVTITVHPPLPFTPEANHGSVALDVVLDADRIYAGDGYAAYVKPFRTIEDLHVTAAITAHLLRLGRAQAWPGALLARVVAQLELARSLAARPPADPMLHITLDGYLSQLRALVRDVDDHWPEDDVNGTRWRRDTPLLTIADGVRRQRSLRAWEAFP